MRNQLWLSLPTKTSRNLNLTDSTFTLGWESTLKRIVGPQKPSNDQTMGASNHTWVITGFDLDDLGLGHMVPNYFIIPGNNWAVAAIYRGWLMMSSGIILNGRKAGLVVPNLWGFYFFFVSLWVLFFCICWNISGLCQKWCALLFSSLRVLIRPGSRIFLIWGSSARETYGNCKHYPVITPWQYVAMANPLEMEVPPFAGKIIPSMEGDPFAKVRPLKSRRSREARFLGGGYVKLCILLSSTF